MHMKTWREEKSVVRNTHAFIISLIEPPASFSISSIAHTSFLSSPPPRVEFPVQSSTLKLQRRCLWWSSWTFPMATSSLPMTTIAHKHWRNILFAEVVDRPLALACRSRMALLAMLLRSADVVCVSILLCSMKFDNLTLLLHSLLVIQEGQFRILTSGLSTW